VILKPTVLCDSMSQAASYWSFIPHRVNFFRDWGHGPLVPLWLCHCLIWYLRWTTFA